jgi:GT2 family glycosyltransferase
MPSGCAALYRRATLDEIGFFDERFFAYCEDSDLGLRAVWASWHAWSAPRAVVYHKYSASGGTYSTFKLRLVERNRFWLALRNFTLPMLLGLPFHTAWRYALMAWALLRGSGKGQAAKSESVAALLWGFIRGNIEAALGAPRILFARPKRKRPAREFMKLLRANSASQRDIILTE